MDYAQVIEFAFVSSGLSQHASLARYLESYSLYIPPLMNTNQNTATTHSVYFLYSIGTQDNILLRITFYREIINGFLSLTQLGLCSVYFLFVGQNLKLVLGRVTI